MHEQVRFWLDTVRSPRFESEEIDRSINTVCESLLTEKYDQSRALNNRDAFQRTQKVRDQLGKIVEKWNQTGGQIGIITTAPGESHITINNLSLYRHMLALEVYSGTTRYPVYPLDYDKKTIINRNPFRRPRLGPFSKLYYIEEDGKIVIIHPETISLTDANLYCIRQFTPSKYGFEAGPSYSFGAGQNVIVASKGTSYDGIDYNIGDVIVITSPAFQITSGLAVYDFVNCELSITLHEEITRRAAVNILRSVGDQERANQLLAELAQVG